MERLKKIHFGEDPDNVLDQRSEEISLLEIAWEDWGNQTRILWFKS